jgi:hypothetical protein
VKKGKIYYIRIRLPYLVANSELNKQEIVQTKDEDGSRLKGILVHSGVAHGGHYYSFIYDNESEKWFRFDDEDVSPTTTTTTTTTAPLPLLPTDDVVTYPSIRLGGLRGKKLSLDQYFGAMDAVII